MADPFKPEDLHWQDFSGIHYLVDPKGKLIGSIRKNADGIYESQYGLQPNERYISLTAAREAVVEAFRIGAPEPTKKSEKK